MKTKLFSRTAGAWAWVRRLPGWKKAGIAAATAIVALFALSLMGGVVREYRSLGAEPPFAAKARMATGYAPPPLAATPAAAPAVTLMAEPRRQLDSSGYVQGKTRVGYVAGAARDGDTYGPSGVRLTAATNVPALETWNRQLILTANMALEVKDVRAAYERIQTIARGEGALVTGASLQSSGSAAPGDSHATVVIRVPQDRFTAVRDRLLEFAPGRGGKVIRDAISGEDVTEEYVDLKSRLRHWQSQEVQLLAIMRQARRIPDILSVRNQLSDVQQEIERITGRLKFLRERVDLSTINVEVFQKGKGPVQPVKPTLASTWKDAGKGVSAAWAQSLRNAVHLLALAVAALVYLIPFAVIAALVWAVVKMARRRVAPAPPAAEAAPRGIS